MNLCNPFSRQKTLMMVTVTLLAENLNTCFSITLQLSSDFKKTFLPDLVLTESLMFFFIMSALTHFPVRWPEEQDYLAWFGLPKFSCTFSKIIFNFPFHTDHLYQKRKSNTITVHIPEKSFSKQLRFVRNIYENRLIDFCFQ